LSGVINLVKGTNVLRIGGVSGIFKEYDFAANYEGLPLNEQTLRSAYHVRDFEIFKLSLVLDIKLA
jgi:lariat debranching enzyme